VAVGHRHDHALKTRNVINLKKEEKKKLSQEADQLLLEDKLRLKS
jgi:hypothetical protein